MECDQIRDRDRDECHRLVPVLRLGTGLFYKNVSGYSGTLSIGGKIYPYEYTYAYADVTQNTLMIDSDSHGDSPCRVTVYGPCTNPVWKHYVNNVLYETGKYEGSIPDGHKLVIDTTWI